MTILPQTVAKTYSYIIGVDTHARKHVYSIITYTCLVDAVGSTCATKRCEIS